MLVASIWLLLSARMGSYVDPIGCWTDCESQNCSRRILNHTISVKDFSVTRERCRQSCLAAGFVLAGVEAGHACFCGNSLSFSAPVRQPARQCCTPCAGNATESCGAVYRVDIFSTASSPPATSSNCNSHPIDPRHIANGTEMLRRGYLDQPYCVVLPAPHRWVCTITGSSGGEGSSGEHVQSLWSDDGGRSWSKPVSVEPSPANTAIANAYSTIVIGPGRRIYVIYGMNVDNVTKFPKTNGTIGRTDCQGQFVMRWSQDGVLQCQCLKCLC